MDEKQITEKLAALDEAGKNRALARLIKLVVARSDRARGLALAASAQALKSAKIAVEAARSAQEYSAPDPETAKRLARKEAEIQEAIRKVEVAVKAAGLLEPGRKRMEEHMSKLTRTQKKVYPLLTQGKTDKEIAAALKFSPRTAQMHVTNIKAKLNIEDRDELIIPLPLLG